MLKVLAGSSWGHYKETYCWPTMHWRIQSQAMLRQTGAPTQVTRALRRYRQCRMWLWGRPPGLTRWSVLTIFSRSPSHWKSGTTQTCSLRSTLWTVWRRTTSVMASQLKSQDPDPWSRLSTLDITQLFFLDSAQARKKASSTRIHTRKIRPFSF